MSDTGDSIVITCSKCSKKFLEPDGRFNDNPSVQCPGCGYFVFTDHETLRLYIKAVSHRDDKIGRK